MAFGGSATCDGDVITVVPTDAVRRKVYLAMFGTQIAVEAGTIEKVTYSDKTGVITVQIASKISSVSSMAPAASTILKVRKMAQVGPLGTPVVTSPGNAAERGGWKVDLPSGSATVDMAFQ